MLHFQVGRTAHLILSPWQKLCSFKLTPPCHGFLRLDARSPGFADPPPRLASCLHCVAARAPPNRFGGLHSSAHFPFLSTAWFLVKAVESRKAPPRNQTLEEQL